MPWPRAKKSFFSPRVEAKLLLLFLLLSEGVAEGGPGPALTPGDALKCKGGHEGDSGGQGQRPGQTAPQGPVGPSWASTQAWWRPRQRLQKERLRGRVQDALLGWLLGKRAQTRPSEPLCLLGTGACGKQTRPLFSGAYRQQTSEQRRKTTATVEKCRAESDRVAGEGLSEKMVFKPEAE